MGCMVFILAIATAFSYSRLVLSNPDPWPPKLSRPRMGQGFFSTAKSGAVSSLSKICSQIGIDVIKRGGNAADAMIATEFCVGVIGMESTGIGGGGLMIIRKPDGGYEDVDFRETAPAAAYESMFAGNVNASLRGGLASGVPGVVRGLEYLHKHHALLPWKELIQPSVEVARNGFEVTRDLIVIFERQKEGQFLTDDPTWAEDFAPTGKLVKLGDKMTRKRYARLLEQIAEGGSDAFYSGPIADATIRTIQAKKGTMTADDLANYKVELRTPLNITYRDWRITGCSGPCGGAVVLSVMKTVEGYKDIGQDHTLDLSLHRLDEAIRFGYGARTELGDPSFVGNMSAIEQNMVAATRAEKIRARISDSNTQVLEAYDPSGVEIVQTHGTSQVVTADRTGLAISLTSTLNIWFGSRVMVPETGLILNNEMNDFSIPGTTSFFGYIASPANYIRPGKRPLSSMAPTIVESLSDGARRFLVLGTTGGSAIITATVQGLWNVLDRNMSLESAVKVPRFHDQLVPNKCVFEYEYENSSTSFMTGKGHNVTWDRRDTDLMTLRRLPDGVFEAAAESLNLEDAAGLVV